METVGLLLRIIVTWFVMDVISGFVHWSEDSYGHPSIPFVGRHVTKPNLLHHYRPRAFVANSWYSSSDLLLVACLASLLIALALGRLTPMVVLAAVLGANANQIHKWSHRTPGENGAMIVAMQGLKLIQSPGHHNGHHSDGKDSRYCVLTDFINPILDWCHFWRGLEFWIWRIFGVKKRNDDGLLSLVLAEEPDFLGDAPRQRGHRQASSVAGPGRRLSEPG